MNSRTSVAIASRIPDNLLLPIEAPRDAWPALLERAADALGEVRTLDAPTLALELRAIALALRSQVSA